MRNISIQREQSDLYLKKVTDLAVEAGRMLLKNGAEIFRVEETITRMCNSYGIDVVDVVIAAKHEYFKLNPFEKIITFFNIYFFNIF